MTFKDMVSRLMSNEKNFSYLDNLVNNSDKDTIKLDSDIVSGASDKLEYREGIEIKRDNLVIDGNGHTIDAKNNGRIFKVEDKTVIFKNITFTHGKSLPKDASFESFFNSSFGGGAVYAAGCKISFINCRFADNADNRGSAIYFGYSDATIGDCDFINNTASEFGGAILNDDDSNLTIMNSRFLNNSAFKYGGSIYNVESSLKLLGCDFANQTLDENAIKTCISGNLILRDCSFTNANVFLNNICVARNCRFNDCEITVSENGDLYYLKDDGDTISFSGNNVHHFDQEKDGIKELTMYEMAGEFVKFFPRFNDADFKEQDKIHDEMVEFLEVWRRMCSWETNFVMAHVIVNVLDLSLEEIEENYMHLVNRDAAMDPSQFDTLHEIFEEVLKFKEIPPQNFKELDGLIHSGDNSIKFRSDFILDESEIAEYKDGIEIDVHDLVIDGNGHVIDAKGNAQMFRIDARNVSFKNITFKNGFGKMGGAISNIGDVDFISCRFIDNMASELGGAIVNDERMTISDCEFIENSTGGVGGAIAATYVSNLEIKNTKFVKNKSSLDIDCIGEVIPSDAQGFGGAIYNNGKLEIDECEFDENSADRCGGAMIILPESKVNIVNVSFKSNTSRLDGGVIYNMGEIEFRNSKFSNNSAENSAGAIYALESSKIKLVNSKFDGNDSHNRAVFNKGKLELVNCEISNTDIVNEGDLSVNDNALPDNI